LTNLSWGWFYGSHQTPTLILTGANNNYNLAIELNSPTNLVSGLSYENGILTSTSNTITSSPFEVETGNPNLLPLRGTLTLKYKSETNIPEIEKENRKPVAFYNIMGVKLPVEPQNGIYIILYDNGTAEKVMR
jgi:hypothetical protein